MISKDIMVELAVLIGAMDCQPVDQETGMSLLGIYAVEGSINIALILNKFVGLNGVPKETTLLPEVMTINQLSILIRTIHRSLNFTSIRLQSRLLDGVRVILQHLLQEEEPQTDILDSSQLKLSLKITRLIQVLRSVPQPFLRFLMN